MALYYQLIVIIMMRMIILEIEKHWPFRVKSEAYIFVISLSTNHSVCIEKLNE